jgi:hypothetical protein
MSAHRNLADAVPTELGVERVFAKPFNQDLDALLGV